MSKKKCCRCDKLAVGKGMQYVTVKLVGITTRIEKLRFCEEHGSHLSGQISQAVIHAMCGKSYEIEVLLD